MLQEENEIVLDKVRCHCHWMFFIDNKLFYSVSHNNFCGLQLYRAEELREAAEARARELEKQVLIQLSLVVHLH